MHYFVELSFFNDMIRKTKKKKKKLQIISIDYITKRFGYYYNNICKRIKKNLAERRLVKLQLKFF